MVKANMSATVASARPSSVGVLDATVGELQEHAHAFARLGAGARADLVRRCLAALLAVAPAWSAAGLRAKEVDAGSGEEWLSGPLPLARHLRLLAESLDRVAVRGRPALGTGAHHRDDGRLAVNLFPGTRLDSALYRGVRGYVLMQPGVDRDAAISLQAQSYQRGDPQGQVSLVLSAGNVSSIGAMDALTKMFNDGDACLLKMNPVNEWVGPYVERVFEPLITAGFLRVVYGGADVGRYLSQHDGVDSIHLTGSAATHDAIVWGPPGADSDRRRAGNQPLRRVPITSELGNVSPVAVVPHTYTPAELAFQARNVATMVTNNVSFNCNSAKMVITAQGWRQRDQFFELLSGFLSATPTRTAYYPGAVDRYRLLTEDRDRVHRLGQPRAGQLPWTIIRNVDSGAVKEPLFSTEPFCPILSETSVAGADPVEFLARATQLMNDTLWGTLSAMIVVPPQLERDPVVGRALDQAVTDLRYGVVAINQWAALAYGLASFPWGGHPSSSPQDIQSGLGWVHNTFMLDGIEKVVVRGNVMVRPDPVWFTGHRKSGALGPQLVALEAQPRWRKLPRLLLSLSSPAPRASRSVLAG